MMDKKNKTDSVDFYKITTLDFNNTNCGLTHSRYQLKSEYGTGYYELHSYNGLYVSVFNAEFKKDIILKGTIEEDALEISFLINGQQIIDITNIKKDLVYENGECFLMYLLPKIHESILYRKNCKLKQVSIIMDSSFIKKHDLLNDIKSLNVASLIKKKKDFILPICNKKQEILNTILKDDQKGLTKRLFLESQSLQLLALQLNEIKRNKNVPVNGLVKKLYAIKHFISSNLDSQFTIQELSQKYILNDFILKKEFKQLFGKTIFEYSTELKMKKAKDLLINTKKPIYEISEFIGYKNATHFSAAFKKHHGITPKQYQKSY